MKIKIIVISIIVIILFMLVYGFTSYNTQMKLDIADEVCEEIRISIYDKDNANYYDFTIKATESTRALNKELIINKIIDKLLEVIK